MSVNKAILVGRVGRDPESRFTGSGQQVTNFSLATDESYKDKFGNKQKKSEWHKVVVWGKLAELVGKYVKKGSLVYVEGRIQSRQYENKEGQQKNVTEIVGSVVRFLSSNNSSEENSDGEQTGTDEDATF